MSRRPSYREGVRWIAANDEPTVTDLATLESLISVALLADLFGHPRSKVALDVARVREQLREDDATALRLAREIDAVVLRSGARIVGPRFFGADRDLAGKLLASATDRAKAEVYTSLYLKATRGGEPEPLLCPLCKVYNVYGSETPCALCQGGGP